MEVRDMGLIVDRGVGGPNGIWLSSIADLASVIRAVSNVAETASMVSAVASATNMAYIANLTPGVNVTVQTAWWYNGAVAHGNVDVGIYDRNLLRLASTGAVAQSGTVVIQSAALSVPVALLAGVPYLLVISTSSASAQFQSLDSGTASNAPILGWTQMAAAHPLPGVIVPATMAIKQLFICGVTSRTL